MLETDYLTFHHLLCKPRNSQKKPIAVSDALFGHRKKIKQTSSNSLDRASINEYEKNEFSRKKPRLSFGSQSRRKINRTP